MLLEKLKVRNFRQFYGDQELTFSTDEKKNVTVIHGRNGGGKTALRNAITWCLYGELDKDLDMPDKLINFAFVDESGSTCRVELEVLYEGDRYHIQRQLPFPNSPTKFSINKIYDDGKHDPIDNPDNFVNSILPKDMSEHFFFHGESKAPKTEDKRKVRQAIRDILGFAFAEQAVEDLIKIKKKQSRALQEKLKENQKLTSLNNERVATRELLEGIESERGSLKTEIENAQSKLSELRKKIDQSGHKQAKENQHQRLIAINSQKQVEADIKEIEGEKRQLVQKYGWAIFGYKLAQEGLDFIDESTMKGRIPAPYEAVFVNDLLGQELCICGRELKENSIESDRVKSLLETANTGLITQRVQKARGVADKLTDQAREFLREYSGVEKRLSAKNKSLRDLELQIKSLGDDTKEIDHKEVSSWQEQLEQTEKLLNSLNQKLGQTTYRANELAEKIKKITNELKIEGVNSAVQLRLERYEQFVEKLIIKCQSRMESYEDSARGALISRINDILAAYTRSERKAILGKNFDLELRMLDKDGKVGQIAPKSTGEANLINLAFVSALVRFAQDRMSAKGEFLIGGTVAPFVMDAPFGQLDPEYKAATAEFVPELARQVVLFVSPAQFNDVVEEKMRPKIGQEYYVKKLSTKKNGPTDELDINGIKVLCSEYGHIKEYSTIERL